MAIFLKSQFMACLPKRNSPIMNASMGCSTMIHLVSGGRSENQLRNIETEKKRALRNPGGIPTRVFLLHLGKPGLC